MRILRLVLGVAILVQGLVAWDAITIVLGVAFSVMAFANVGCCGINGCAVNTNPANNKPEKTTCE